MQIEKDFEALYREEERIVSRVWEALGISTYEQAGGKAIFEIVKEQREMNMALVEALEYFADLTLAPDGTTLEKIDRRAMTAARAVLKRVYGEE